MYFVQLIGLKDPNPNHKVQQTFDLQIKYDDYQNLKSFKEYCVLTFPSYRIFLMIENSSQDHTRTDSGSTSEVKLNAEESLLEIGLLSTFNAIMQQTSQQIYHVSLRFYPCRISV